MFKVILIIILSTCVLSCSKYKKTVLDNGITVVTENNQSQLTGIYFHVRQGSRYENDNTRGYSHILEHMLFRGAKHRTSRDVKHILARGGYTNATTGYAGVGFYSRQFSNQYMEALDTYLDMLTNFYVKDEDLNLELGAILREYDNRLNNSDLRKYHSQMQELYDVKSNLIYDIIGTRKSIQSANYFKLKDFLKQYYTGANIVLSIAGDVDHNKIVKKINDSTKTIENGKVNTFSEAIFNPKDKRYVFKKDKQFEGVSIALFFKDNYFYKTINKKDNKRIKTESFYIDLFNESVCGGFESRFFNILREKMGLIYSSHCNIVTHKDTGYFFVEIKTSYKDARNAYKVLVDEFINAIGNISESEFKYRVKSILPHYIIESEIGSLDDTSMDLAFKNGHNVIEDDYSKPLTTKEKYKILSDIKLSDMNNYIKKLLLNQEIRPIVITYGAKDPKLDGEYLSKKINTRLLNLQK